MAVLKPTVWKSPNTTTADSFQTFIIHNDILTTAHDVFVDSTQSTSTAIPIYELGKHLLSASKNGNISEIKSLMGRGAAFTPDWLGACPLHYAASNGHVGACEVLLRAGISRNSRTKVDRTPLHMAAYEGHLDVVQCLIKHGADVNARDMLLMTPLQWAVQRATATINAADNRANSIALVATLLRHGANVRTENKFGNTALDIARQVDHAELVGVLQKAFVDQVDQVDQMENEIDDGLGGLLQCNVNSLVEHQQVNEYLNDVIKISATTNSVVAKEPPDSCQQQQQVITIEDCIDDDDEEEGDDLNQDVHSIDQQVDAIDDAAGNKAAPLLSAGDAGYCSSSSDQQSAALNTNNVQPTIHQHHIDLTKDETINIDIEDNTTVEQQQSADIDPYRVLRQRYGIELLPEVEEDGGRILKQAMDSGHSVSLTEAGRRALSEFKLKAEVNKDVSINQQKQQPEYKKLMIHQKQSTNEQGPLQVQLIDGKVVPSMSKDRKVQHISTIGTPIKLPSNIVSTTKRKRLLPSTFAYSTSKIVLVPDTIGTKIDDKQAPSGGSTRLHELIAPATAPSSFDNGTKSTGVHKQIRHNKQQQIVKQLQHKQQQETTLLTLTADEFASLQANGGILTTSNGIYRIMDYNDTPVKTNGTKHKRTRVLDLDGGTNVIVRDPDIQQRQMESETVKSLRQQLQEQRHLVDIYKRKYLKKEAEVERFKQQLKLMLKHRSSNSNLNSAIFNNNGGNGR